jgi:cytochrome c biogenesis protein CcdA
MGSFAKYIAAALFLFFGLYLLGAIPLPSAGLATLRTQGNGFFTAFFFGLIFGAALGPCAFAFLAPIIGIALQATPRNLAFAISSLLLVIPPIFVLLRLLDLWVPREKMVRFMGEGSGLRGIRLLPWRCSRRTPLRRLSDRWCLHEKRGERPR